MQYSEGAQRKQTDEKKKKKKKKQLHFKCVWLKAIANAAFATNLCKKVKKKKKWRRRHQHRSCPFQQSDHVAFTQRSGVKFPKLREALFFVVVVVVVCQEISKVKRKKSLNIKQR